MIIIAMMIMIMMMINVTNLSWKQNISSFFYFEGNSLFLKKVFFASESFWAFQFDDAL